MSHTPHLPRRRTFSPAPSSVGDVDQARRVRTITILLWAGIPSLLFGALLGYFPCFSEGNEIDVLDPDDHSKELERFVAPRQPGHDRICLADFYRPKDSGELDVVAFQAVTAGDEVTELMAQLEKDGEFAEQLFVHGLGVHKAEGMAEWLHARVRSEPGSEFPEAGRVVSVQSTSKTSKNSRES